MVEVEPFKRNPRKCYRCQRYGHVSRFCSMSDDSQVCGKRMGAHATRECNANESEFKCAACPDNPGHAGTECKSIF